MIIPLIGVLWEGFTIYLPIILGLIGFYLLAYSIYKKSKNTHILFITWVIFTNVSYICERRV